MSLLTIPELKVLQQFCSAFTVSLKVSLKILMNLLVHSVLNLFLGIDLKLASYTLILISTATLQLTESLTIKNDCPYHRIPDFYHNFNAV